ncbi:hypothetical protein D3C85_1601380 [compost metagenome]
MAGTGDIFHRLAQRLFSVVDGLLGSDAKVNDVFFGKLVESVGTVAELFGEFRFSLLFRQQCVFSQAFCTLVTVSLGVFDLFAG